MYYPDAIYLICSLEDEAAPVLRGLWWLVAQSVATAWRAADWDALRVGLPFRVCAPVSWGCFADPNAPLPVALPMAPALPDSPCYLVFALDDGGAWVDGRLVTVRESPVVIV